MIRRFLALGLFLSLLFVVSCGKGKNEQERLVYEADGTSDIPGVSMNAEKSKYPGDISEIDVLWTNDTDKEFMFGEPFSIQKKEGGEWKPAGKSEAVFLSIGYSLSSHTQKKHRYDLRVFVDAMEKGEYQIITSFLYVRAPGDYDDYKISTSFLID